MLPLLLQNTKPSRKRLESRVSADCGVVPGRSTDANAATSVCDELSPPERSADEDAMALEINVLPTEPEERTGYGNLQDTVAFLPKSASRASKSPEEVVPSGEASKRRNRRKRCVEGGIRRAASTHTLYQVPAATALVG